MLKPSGVRLGGIAADVLTVNDANADDPDGPPDPGRDDDEDDSASPRSWASARSREPNDDDDEWEEDADASETRACGTRGLPNLNSDTDVDLTGGATTLASCNCVDSEAVSCCKSSLRSSGALPVVMVASVGKNERAWPVSKLGVT